jgi:hypothetical protein
MESHTSTGGPVGGSSPTSRSPARTPCRTPGWSACPERCSPTRTKARGGSSAPGRVRRWRSSRSPRWSRLGSGRAVGESGSETVSPFRRIRRRRLGWRSRPRRRRRRRWSTSGTWSTAGAGWSRRGTGTRRRSSPTTPKPDPPRSMHWTTWTAARRNSAESIVSANTAGRRTGGRTGGSAHRASGIGIDAAPPWGRPRRPSPPKGAPAGSPG